MSTPSRLTVGRTSTGYLIALEGRGTLFQSPSFPGSRGPLSARRVDDAGRGLDGLRVLGQHVSRLSREPSPQVQQKWPNSPGSPYSRRCARRIAAQFASESFLCVRDKHPGSSGRGSFGRHVSSRPRCASQACGRSPSPPGRTRWRRRSGFRPNCAKHRQRVTAACRRREILLANANHRVPGSRLVYLRVTPIRWIAAKLASASLEDQVNRSIDPITSRPRLSIQFA
jgi:hypothetical protein